MCDMKKANEDASITSRINIIRANINRLAAVTNQVAQKVFACKKIESSHAKEQILWF